MNPHDYRRRRGASRRRTDSPCETRTGDNVVHDPFRHTITMLAAGLRLRQTLPSSERARMQAKLHPSLVSLARARAAGIKLTGIEDHEHLDRIVSALAAKAAAVVDPTEEAVP